MSPVRTDIGEHIATITITPDPAGYDRAFLDHLNAAAEAIAADDDVRAVVLQAEGAFGSGWAPSALEDGGDLWHAIEAIAALPQPSIAALSGQVRSAAVELALACDIRLGAEDARFAMPDTAAGEVPRAGGTQRLPRAVGRGQALRLLLTGEEIDAAEALRIGLVSAVVPSGDVQAAARRLATVIASRAPLATRLAKEAVHRGSEMPLEQALRYELDLTVILQSTADRAEGVRAFVEKRPPNFIGR